MDEFLEPHLRRARAGEAHPVWDFLFTYYSLRPRQLRVWHPGFGVVLGGDRGAALPRPHRIRPAPGRCHGDRASTCVARADTVRFIAELLRATATRVRPG